MTKPQNPTELEKIIYVSASKLDVDVIVFPVVFIKRLYHKKQPLIFQFLFQKKFI